MCSTGVGGWGVWMYQYHFGGAFFYGVFIWYICCGTECVGGLVEENCVFLWSFWGCRLRAEGRSGEGALVSTECVLSCDELCRFASSRGD